MPSPVSGVFYLLGPTAVGKSELAVEVAERCNAEIVSADAFQVYRGLDILTAKPSAEMLKRVPHHLVGEIPLSSDFNVAAYLAAASARIVEISARGQRAIVVGGTGLYIRALSRGLAELPSANPALRAELETLPLAELQTRLRALDPAAAASIDLRNPRRLIRALEVCTLTGRPFSSFRKEWDAPTAKLRGVVLTRERTDLYARIDARTEAMFAAGVVDEVRQTGKIGPTAAQTIGFREIQSFLAGKMTLGECIAAIQMATRNYARRQLTWFRKERDFEALDLDPEPSREAAVLTIVERAEQALA